MFEDSLIEKEIYKKNKGYGNVGSNEIETHYFSDLLPYDSKLVLKASRLEYDKSCSEFLHGKSSLYYVDKGNFKLVVNYIFFYF